MTNRNTLDLGKPDWKETATREELIAKIKNQRVEINNLLDQAQRLRPCIPVPARISFLRKLWQVD